MKMRVRDTVVPRRAKNSRGDDARRLSEVHNFLSVHHEHEQRLYLELINFQFARHKKRLKADEQVTVHVIASSESAKSFIGNACNVFFNDDRFKTSVVLLDGGKEDWGAHNISCAEVLPYAEYDPYETLPHVLVYQLMSDSLYERYPRIKPNFIKKSGIRTICYISGTLDIPSTASPLTVLRMCNTPGILFAWRVLVEDMSVEALLRQHSLISGRNILSHSDKGWGSITEALAVDG